VTLKIHRPKAFAHLSQKEWAEKVRDLVQAKETQARERRAREGKKVLGVERILAQNPSSRPKSHAPHFKLSPRLAAKNKWARIEALRRNRAFLDKYRDAIKLHLEGAGSVLFPFGTYWMKKFGKVVCEATEAAAPVRGSPPASAPA
jgi:hypothetical protein